MSCLTEDIKLTKDAYLARCANAFDMGLITPETLRLLNRWLDFVMRFEGGQMGFVVDFLEQENQRLDHFYPQKTLANDADGYKLIQLAAVLGHSCQACAEDPQAWHTRGVFCRHKDKPTAPLGEAVRGGE